MLTNAKFKLLELNERWFKCPNGQNGYNLQVTVLTQTPSYVMCYDGFQSKWPIFEAKLDKISLEQVS